MRGADEVRDRLTLLLASEMPRKIPLLRQEWGVGSDRLPDVTRWVSGDIPDETVDTGCWVIVVNPRLLRMVRTGDFSPAGEPEFRNRYACRVYVWVLGQDWDTAAAARDNTAVCARLSMIQYPTLTNEGGDTGCVLHEDTYTEDFGTPARVKGGRCWAAAILSVDIDVYEHVDAGTTLPALGAAEQITPTASAVGPGRPFEESE